MDLQAGKCEASLASDLPTPCCFALLSQCQRPARPTKRTPL